VSLSWSASTDNKGVKGYRIYRNGALAGTVTSGLSYVMAQLRCNTTYIVTVSAYDAAGNASLPAAIFAKTAACGSDEPPCPTPSTVFQLLQEHKIQYGCAWPGGIFAKQAIQSVRVMLAARGRTLETWRGKKWHKVALQELDAATSKAGAWGSNGVLQPNAAGLAVQYKIGRVIRVLHWNNPELFEVSKSEKWALTAISWYISASEYNRRFAIVGATPTMNSALYDLKRADADFFSNVCYRAWGRYRQVWQRVSGL
jgi:chitodextrinase